MLGGKISAEAAGLKLQHREEIYARISSFAEGELFRAEDVVADDLHLMDDFSALRGYDYVHVVDGYLTGIRESKYLRHLPSVARLMTHYEAMIGESLVDTGDRVAWKLRIKEFEPILGHRYYAPTHRATLSLNRIRIQIIPAPEWLRDESFEARLLRTFLDTPSKDMPVTVRRALEVVRMPAAQLQSIADRAAELAGEATPELLETLQTPGDLAETMGRELKLIQDARK